jgi:hypothetical protein
MTLSRAAALMVAAPPIAIALGWVTLLALTAMTGRHPWWNLEPHNLPEAAALRNSGAVVRMVDGGADLTRAADVRAGIVLDDRAVLTPLEAAAASRDSAMVQLLFDLGAMPDSAGWHRAWCLATASSVQDVLDAHQPPGASKSCDETR